MRTPTRLQLRRQIEREVLNQLTLSEIKKIEREVYPYFKHVIEEENTKLKTHLLMTGQFKLLEAMSKEEERLLNEGIFDTVADIGITAGQMIGGGVGQAAGLAGLAKYTPEFQANIDKDFSDWFGPFISLFFSVQALVFPMPAAASLKGIMIGFAKGLKGILKGTGGLAAKGVTLLFKKGSGFIGSAAGTIAKAVKGILAAFAKGGEMIKAIAKKIGGEGVIKPLMTSFKKAGETVVKKLNSLKDALKGAKDLTDDGVKGIVKRVFGAGDDAVAVTGKLTPALKAVADSKIANAAFKASQAGREAFSQWVRKHMAKNVDEFAKALKPLEGKVYEGLGTFKGLTSGGAFKFKFGKTKSFFLSSFFDVKLFGNFIRKMAELREPAIDILLASMHLIMPGIKKALGRGATEIARMSAAAAGGGIDDQFMEDYISGKTASGKEIEKRKKDLKESQWLDNLIWENSRKSQVIRNRKIIRLLN